MGRSIKTRAQRTRTIQAVKRYKTTDVKQNVLVGVKVNVPPLEIHLFYSTRPQSKTPPHIWRHCVATVHHSLPPGGRLKLLHILSKQTLMGVLFALASLLTIPTAVAIREHVDQTIWNGIKVLIHVLSFHEQSDCILQSVLNQHRSPIHHECEVGSNEEQVRKSSVLDMHSPATEQMLVALTKTLSINRRDLFSKPYNVLHLLCQNTAGRAERLLSVLLDSKAEDLAGVHQLLVEGDEFVCGTTAPHPLSDEEVYGLSSMQDAKQQQLPLHIACEKGDCAKVVHIKFVQNSI